LQHNYTKNIFKNFKLSHAMNIHNKIKFHQHTVAPKTCLFIKASKRPCVRQNVLHNRKKYNIYMK